MQLDKVLKAASMLLLVLVRITLLLRTPTNRSWFVRLSAIGNMVMERRITKIAGRPLPEFTFVKTLRVCTMTLPRAEKNR